MANLIGVSSMDELRAEIQYEPAPERPAGMARENRETSPYVVRDLSWELARYLEGADDER